jgi:hypothetical protein
VSKFDRNYGKDGRRGAAVREMPCITDSGCWKPARGAQLCWGVPEAAHARARGGGGVKGDSGDLFPACTGHHRQQERIGNTAFNALYGVNVVAKAASVKAGLDERFGAEPCYQCEQTEGHSAMCKTMEAEQERREARLRETS